MGGYTKNIAVIKGLKDGFSANGGELSGLVKVEKYGSNLRIEVAKINFAPLSEGRFVTALSDGKTSVVFDGDVFDGTSDMQTGNGFAALVCFVNGGVQPVASAVCGNFHAVALGLKAEVERTEKSVKNGDSERGFSEKPSEKGGGEISDETGNASEIEAEVYEDEAIAEENYYEFGQDYEGGGVVCAATEEEKDGGEFKEDENSAGSVEEARRLRLAGGAFYERMKNEIEGLLSVYPPEEEICRIIEGSKWVKISYGEGMYYVFGVISEAGKPKYLGYGVPVSTHGAPPESMAGMASFIPDKSGGGWWIVYQDAETGASLKLEAE